MMPGMMSEQPAMNGTPAKPAGAGVAPTSVVGTMINVLPADAAKLGLNPANLKPGMPVDLDVKTIVVTTAPLRLRIRDIRPGGETTDQKSSAFNALKQAGPGGPAPAVA